VGGSAGLFGIPVPDAEAFSMFACRSIRVDIDALDWPERTTGPTVSNRPESSFRDHSRHDTLKTEIEYGREQA
jgi:hypothetical protein